MTYPDGEVLSYQYDSGGLVRKAVGVKGNFTYPYLNRLEYDKFGERAFVEAGNGVRTSYTYDPQNRLLANLKAGKANSAPFQNQDYTYDPVGNVLSQANNVAIPPASQPGGPTSATFRYDDLNRLVGATGSYRYAANKQRQYSLSMAYDTLDNPIAKQQTDQIVQPSANPIVQQPTSYSFSYGYGGTQPHAPTHIGDRSFSYDADGNQTGWTGDQNGTRRSIVWDEENRIQSIVENGQPLTFTYNDAGERVTKRGPQGETAYVNPYFTIRDGTDGTKHIYAGGVRVVSKLVKPNTQEQDQYYFHADQLGSTNYVTDASGAIYQHLEYFPSGETWIDESGSTQRTPYLFTGKELDEETGLYYFGARYYDPRTGVWQSADPILGDYLDGAPNDGVYDPLNNNLYGYVHQSPTNYTDPDGLTHKPGHVKRKVAVESARKGRTARGLTLGGYSKRIRVERQRYEPGEGGEATTASVTFGPEFGGETRTVLNPNGQYTKKLKITYQGTRAKDFAVANSFFGYKKTPKGFVWHHFHDYDPDSDTGTLYLMRKSVHKVSHSGGVWMYKQRWGGTYGA
jgi:RHS repeat-associated protein